MPQLRLGPPAVYHEKVRKESDLMLGETSRSTSKLEIPMKNRHRQVRELKLKGSTLRVPLKSYMFGKCISLIILVSFNHSSLNQAIPLQAKTRWHDLDVIGYVQIRIHSSLCID